MVGALDAFNKLLCGESSRALDAFQLLCGESLQIFSVGAQAASAATGVAAFVGALARLQGRLGLLPSNMDSPQNASW